MVEFQNCKSNNSREPIFFPRDTRNLNGYSGYLNSPINNTNTNVGKKEPNYLIDTYLSGTGSEPISI